MPRIPVTVVGGYLGAGKTTLVNTLLRQADGLRLTVLVNDFGALPIDEDLIESQNGDVMSISGGCICCSYGSDLMAALIDVSRFDPRPDHLLIEASGVSLPLAIAQSVSLVADFALEGIVVLADAETVRDRGHDRYLADTIARQLTAADLILLNKIDLVSAERVKEVRAWLADVAPESRIVGTVNADMPLSQFLAPRTQRPAPFASKDRHDHHANRFSTASFEIAQTVAPDDLARGLAVHELGLIRSKGFVRALNGQFRTIQTVGSRWSVTAAPDDLETVGHLVCIAYPNPVDVEAIRGLIEASSETIA